LELRVAAKRFPLEELEDYRCIGTSHLSPIDEHEIAQFLKIEFGLNLRKNRVQELPLLVEACISEKRYNEAIEFLQEWAMMDKMNLRIYELRIFCFRAIGEEKLAQRDEQMLELLKG
jgi:hypothetical protein